MRRLSPSPTVTWLAVGGCVVALFFLLGVGASALSPGPSGPALSSYATTQSGVAAWAELLGRDGHRVGQLRQPIANGSLPADATLVILSGAPLPGSETRTLQAFLNRGGRLVLGGAASATGAGLSGRVVAIPDISFLENRQLAIGGNALRALQLAGAPSRPVYFDETLHGYGPATGLSALPERWWLALSVIALALLSWVLSRALRLGGSDPLPPASQSPRAAYIEAMAATLVRSGTREQLLAGITAAADRESAFRQSL